jgi:hypothetical protein
MDITVSAPSACEARVRRVEGENAFVLQPVFTASRDRKTVLYLTVTGDNGRERLFTVDVSGVTGKLALTELRKVVPQFDREPAGTVDDEAAGEPDLPEPVRMFDSAAKEGE